MKIGNLVILNNKKDRYAIIDIKKRIREVYIKGNSEAAYAAYRIITGATVFESWHVVKPWIEEWEEKVMEELVTLRLATYDQLQMELSNLQDEVKTLRNATPVEGDSND